MDGLSTLLSTLRPLLVIVVVSALLLLNVCFASKTVDLQELYERRRGALLLPR